MKTLLLFPVLLLLSSPALARLGETREQCNTRYGKPVRESEDHLSSIHEKAGFTIVCMFHEGKCTCVAFTKLEKDPQGNPLPLSDVEIKTLLEASSHGRSWTKVEPEKKVPGLDATRWLLDEDEALYLGSPLHFLTIMSKEHAEREKAKQADKEKSNLKDF